ncbi:MAG: hypothetical protein QOJ15_1059 [Bradyrhizobium sp.]|nr:hypothetical protein [Bradyrhizobium sp.]
MRTDTVVVDTEQRAVVVSAPLIGAIEVLLRSIIEVPAALLVVAELVLLFAGVVSRYIFHAPLVWSDELASVLFLWLSMLGAVVATYRGGHMRLTTFVNRAPPGRRIVMDALAMAVVILFVALILTPAIGYVASEEMILTPALGIRNSWKAAAIEVGAILMLAVAILRLLKGTSALIAVAVLAAVAAGAAALWLARPVLLELGNYNLLIFFVVLVGGSVLAGVPIAFAFGASTLGYLSLATDVPLEIVVSRMDEGMSSMILLAAPLFVFLGLLIEMTGMARAMVEFLSALLGRVRGGLSFALLGAMYLVSGISGSKTADMAAVAPALFPEMQRRGAKPGEMVALLAASGAMAETIPPSLVLIALASVASISIAGLFTGGLLPAAVLALALAVVAYFRSGQEDLSHVQRASMRRVLATFITALPALAMPFLIRAAVVEGVTTATEVSTIGVFYALTVGSLLYRGFKPRLLYPILVDTAALSGALLLIVGTATAMAWALTQSGFSRELAAIMKAAPGGSAGFMAVSILAFIVLGSVLEGIPALLLFGPLLFPIARSIGIHEIHYAMVVVLAMGLGLFAPPFGIGFYAACAIARISPDAAIGRIWPYLGVLLLGLVLVAVVPWLSTGFL